MPNRNVDYQASLDELYRAVLTIQSVDECRDFFSDLFTKQELVNLSQRFLIAKLLLSGETYDMVHQKVSVSSSTITRINTELQFGSGGYKKVLERIRQLDTETKTSDMSTTEQN